MYLNNVKHEEHKKLEKTFRRTHVGGNTLKFDFELDKRTVPRGYNDIIKSMYEGVVTIVNKCENYWWRDN